MRSTCVAGVYTPAFVERTPSLRAVPVGPGVSPEFILRPSLSEPEVVVLDVLQKCRRSLYSGLR